MSFRIPSAVFNACSGGVVFLFGMLAYSDPGPRGHSSVTIVESFVLAGTGAWMVASVVPLVLRWRRAFLLSVWMQWMSVPMFAGTVLCVTKSVQAMPAGHSKMAAGFAAMLISTILGVMGVISLLIAVLLTQRYARSRPDANR